jgi:hypothetical protein
MNVINPESSDPNDPETNTWWIWIPVLFTLLVLTAICFFGRELLFESILRSPAASLLQVG